MANIVVPFISAKEGDGRLQAQIIGRALARAGYGNLTWATRGRKKWDPRLTMLLRQFELANGIHHGTATKSYTMQTHKKLARFYDAYNLKLVAIWRSLSKEDAKREAVVANLMYLYNIRWNLQYSQARPWDRRKPPRRLDCSGAKGWADERAGLPTPGLPYGWGNTWSMTDYYMGRHALRDLNQVQRGDPIFYGRSVTDPTHMTIYLGRRDDGEDMVFSNGSYPCKVLPIDYRGDRVSIFDLLP